MKIYKIAGESGGFRILIIGDKKNGQFRVEVVDSVTGQKIDCSGRKHKIHEEAMKRVCKELGIIVDQGINPDHFKQKIEETPLKEKENKDLTGLNPFGEQEGRSKVGL